MARPRRTSAGSGVLYAGAVATGTDAPQPAGIKRVR